MNLDDKDLFLDAMGDVTPLKARSNVQWLKPPVTKPLRQHPDEQQLDNPLERGFLEIVPCATPLEFHAEGIQLGVLDKLRQGKYPLDATLNLLRQPVETCRQQLWQFICQAEASNQRNLLIVHGKGRDDTSHANIVRSYLARWLTQLEQVQAFCCAQPQHGGAGACYIGLRKSELARMENRERHAKHSR